MVNKKSVLKAQDKIFKVSEFNEFVNLYLAGMGEVVVEGEISQIKVNQNKWLFVTIKDDQSSVEVFGMVFKIHNWDILQEGMLVHVWGIPRIYQKTGRFSIFADQIAPAGEGALRIAFEKLKAKLEKEGLFAPERKRSLPLFPQKIGLITAAGSRAYSDFIKVLKARMGGIKIYFYPIQVQGKNSVDSLLRAFGYFNKNLFDLDLCALVRGGGSLEDLQSFNDERVARAIFASRVPVVCGVGHEEDVSLADLVADLRASTPSNAAELIVKERGQILKQITGCTNIIKNGLEYSLKQKQNFIKGAVHILKEAFDQKTKVFSALISGFLQEFKIFSQKLSEEKQLLVNSKTRLLLSADGWLAQNILKVTHLARLLASLDYRKVLRRGFSITFDKNGKIVRQVEDIQRGTDLLSRVFDGTIYSTVTHTAQEKI